MAINPRFTQLVSAQLALCGTTLFNMQQIHNAMHKADALLADETTAAPKADDTAATLAELGAGQAEVKTALDEASEPEKPTEELNSQNEDQVKTADFPSAPTRGPRGSQRRF